MKTAWSREHRAEGISCTKGTYSKPVHTTTYLRYLSISKLFRFQIVIQYVSRVPNCDAKRGTPQLTRLHFPEPNQSTMSLPLLFTLPPSSRHEFILLDTSSKPSLKSLNKQITATIAGSPNCAEFMGKYKSADVQESIQEFKIHWDTKTRDGKIWPEYTVVTEDNLPAILELLKANPVMGVLEIKVGKSE